MNHLIKKKWITALKSGDYTQGKEWLRHTDKNGNKTHCCLGVLCEVLTQELGAPDIWDPEAESQETNREGFASSVLDGNGGVDHGSLPKWLQDWAGLTTKQCSALIKMNDDHDINFIGIADMISSLIPGEAPSGDAPTKQEQATSNT